MGAAPIVVGILIALVIAAVVLFPLAVIWAINTLFGLNIPMNFWTWLAMVVLMFVFGGGLRLFGGNKKETTVIRTPEFP